VAEERTRQWLIEHPALTLAPLMAVCGLFSLLFAYFDSQEGVVFVAVVLATSQVVLLTWSCRLALLFLRNYRLLDRLWTAVAIGGGFATVVLAATAAAICPSPLSWTGTQMSLGERAGMALVFLLPSGIANAVQIFFASAGIVLAKLIHRCST
jgi:hypothetical protein